MAINHARNNFGRKSYLRDRLQTHALLTIFGNQNVTIFRCCKFAVRFFPVKSAYSKFLSESDSFFIINMLTQNEAIRFQSKRAKTSSSATDQIAF